MANTTVGVIGLGWIGAQFKRYFEEVKGYERGHDLFLYDTDVKKGYFDDVANADVIFLCLPTPRNPKDGSCDVSIINSAVARLKDKKGKVIVIKSTVVPGTTERLQREYPEQKFLFNPEFLTESRAWEDFIRPDRQIVGYTEKSLDAAHLVLSLLPKAPFMAPWGTGTYERTRVTATEAELIKYAGNLYFARKVNWANALARVAENLGANYENVRKGMAADHRIGDSHLDVTHGGYRGFGGYCLPKDLDGFIQFARGAAFKEVVTLLEADRAFNEKLLAEQGLSLEEVSKHIDAYPEKLKKKV